MSRPDKRWVGLVPVWALSMALGMALTLAVTPGPVAAQGTWVHTGCLAVAGAASTTPVAATAAPGGTAATPTPAAPTQHTTPCKASPAWGQTGLDHVQALTAAAGPGNLGISLVKPQTLPAANVARAQLSTVMLAHLDGELPLSAYRWYGPAGANPLTATKSVAAAPAAPGTVQATATVTTSSSPGARPASTTPSVVLNPVYSSWRLGALVNESPEAGARSASWWLAAPYLGSPGPTAPASVVASGAAGRYTTLLFLAEQCPQLEGKVAPNAWTRCTTREVPAPATAPLVLLALALAAVAGRAGRARRAGPGSQVARQV